MIKVNAMIVQRRLHSRRSYVLGRFRRILSFLSRSLFFYGLICAQLKSLVSRARLLNSLTSLKVSKGRNFLRSNLIKDLTASEWLAIGTALMNNKMKKSFSTATKMQAPPRLSP